MEIRQLRSFIKVARLLSFNRAARMLHYAQSSVSAQIHALEEELGVKLFDRLGKSIILTEAGERLVQYAEKISALEEETRSELTGEGKPRGSLTIRMPESLAIYRFPPVIKEFVSKHPGVRLTFTACTHEGLPQDLRKGVTDLGFLLTESIDDADLESEVLGFENIMLVAAAGHPLTLKKQVRANDLLEETFLLSKVDCSYRRTFEKTLEAQGISIQNTITLNSVASLKECAVQGLGLTVLPKMTVGAEIASKKLAPVKWKDGRFEVAILMVWYKERWISPKQKAFMATTRSVINKNHGC
ncbi:MAG: LysR family transcriptional regulator [Deltaproteobacteria bacterium]|nr:LysR family transcriptional regulator [Deltaproteobacteria bacterium]